MSESPELVTVYRSMDADAWEECEAIADLLAGDGLSPVILDDQAVGIPEGVVEVRVPAAQAAQAEETIQASPTALEEDSVDPSSELDLETIYHSEGNHMAELEAMGIKNVLEANGVEAIVFGDSVLPNLAFEVKVARDQVQRARELMAEALLSGPASAEEAELAGERIASGSGEPHSNQ